MMIATQNHKPLVATQTNVLGQQLSASVVGKSMREPVGVHSAHSLDNNLGQRVGLHSSQRKRLDTGYDEWHPTNCPAFGPCKSSGQIAMSLIAR